MNGADHITDKAVTAEVPDAAFKAACAEVGFHPLSDGAQVIRNALAVALPVLNTTTDAEIAALRDALDSIRALVGKYYERDDSLPADLVDEVYALTAAARRGEQG